jgi:hypothetical protein
LVRIIEFDKNEFLANFNFSCPSKNTKAPLFERPFDSSISFSFKLAWPRSAPASSLSEIDGFEFFAKVMAPKY